VIGVIGTDFYVAYANGRTTVLCYEGTLSVTPAAGAKVVDSNNSTTGGTKAVSVSAGQMVVIGMKTAGRGMQLYPAMKKASMNDTNIPRARQVSPSSKYYHRFDGRDCRFDGGVDSNQFKFKTLRVQIVCG